jgi:ubiquinone/menaquinone biosynthesis C-methylase UbiE
MSRYDPDWIRGHYDKLGEDEWHRWDRTPADGVKLHIHCHYLRQHIKSGDRVLDLGAGPGRFTQVLADLGVKVVVADISPVQLDLNRENAHKYSFESTVENWVEIDMCDMGAFEDGEFDAVLCYGGPMSYIFEKRDAALKEILRVLKRSGVALLGVISLWGSARENLIAVLEIPTEENKNIIQTGDHHPDTHKGCLHRCHLFRAKELREFLEKHSCEVLSMSASNCLSVAKWEGLDEVQKDPEKWKELLRMELEASSEPGSLDMGTHLIAVVRKP